MARMPVPVPMSRTAAPGAAASASSRSTRQPSVVPWWPVPNARPGSITTVTRPSALRAVGGRAVEPRRQHAQPAAHLASGEGLLPGARPRLVEQGRDLGVAGQREAQRAQRGPVALDRGQRARWTTSTRRRRRAAAADAGRLLLDDAEGALLPEEVGQPVGDLGRGGDGELPERHQLPNSCFIRSRNLETRGLESLVVGAAELLQQLALARGQRGSAPRRSPRRPRRPGPGRGGAACPCP